MSDFCRLLRNMYCRSGAAEDAIRRCEAEIGVSLPVDYVEFLRFANGGDGFVGDKYMILWAVEELGRFNESYEVAQYCPGFLVFGSSGGGEAFGFDTHMQEWGVFQIPFVGMIWNLAQPLGESFGAFLEGIDRPTRLEGSQSEFKKKIPNPECAGKEIFEVKPIIFGGSGTDMANKVFLSREQHIQAVVFWNKIVKEARGREKY